MDSEHRLGLGLGRLGGAYGYIRTLSFVRYLVSSCRSILLLLLLLLLLASRPLSDRDYSPEDDRVALQFLFKHSQSRISQVCEKTLPREHISHFFSLHACISSARHVYSKAFFVRTTALARWCIVNAVAQKRERERNKRVCSACARRVK